MKLYFYTNNRFKFRVADEIFSRYEIGLFIVKPDFKEIQAEKSEDKVVDALNNAILRHALAEDSGLYIQSLKGFLGVITGYVQRHLTPEVFLRLIEREMEASLLSITGVRTESKIKLFRGEIKGRVIPEQRGYSDYWVDTIFIPYGKNESIAEIGMKNFLPVSDWSISFMSACDYLRGEI